MFSSNDVIVYRPLLGPDLGIIDDTALTKANAISGNDPLYVSKGNYESPELD